MDDQASSSTENVQLEKSYKDYSLDTEHKPVIKNDKLLNRQQQKKVKFNTDAVTETITKIDTKPITGKLTVIYSLLYIDGN